MGVALQRIDLLLPEQVSPGLGSMSPARRRSNRRCASRFTTPVTEKTAVLQMRSSGHGRVRFVGHSGKALTRDGMRRLRFDVHAAGWLHSIVLHGRCCFC